MIFILTIAIGTQNRAKSIGLIQSQVVTAVAMKLTLRNYSVFNGILISTGDITRFPPRMSTFDCAKNCLCLEVEGTSLRYQPTEQQQQVLIVALETLAMKNRANNLLAFMDANKVINSQLFHARR